jgi:RNase P/RNase MRP subunit POP5
MILDVGTLSIFRKKLPFWIICDSDFSNTTIKSRVYLVTDIDSEYYIINSSLKQKIQRILPTYSTSTEAHNVCYELRKGYFHTNYGIVREYYQKSLLPDYPRCNKEYIYTSNTR